VKYWGVLGLIGLVSATAMAQNDRENLSVETMVERLTPAPKTQSQARNLVPTESKLDLTIHFDFDSDKLKERSKPMLDSIASAMQY
jgi:outer membrane protein OmpA-like peptidoglycan-associated protein